MWAAFVRWRVLGVEGVAAHRKFPLRVWARASRRSTGNQLSLSVRFLFVGLQARFRLEVEEQDEEELAIGGGSAASR
eukprot:4782219-Alexandrium_andersonii.AAC.1